MLFVAIAYCLITIDLTVDLIDIKNILYFNSIYRESEQIEVLKTTSIQRLTRYQLSYSIIKSHLSNQQIIIAGQLNELITDIGRVKDALNNNILNEYTQLSYWEYKADILPNFKISSDYLMSGYQSYKARKLTRLLKQLKSVLKYCSMGYRKNFKSQIDGLKQLMEIESVDIGITSTRLYFVNYCHQDTILNDVVMIDTKIIEFEEIAV